MIRILKCRRSSLALIGMCLLAYLGIHNNTDVSIALAGIVASIAAANSAQGFMSKKGSTE